MKLHIPYTSDQHIGGGYTFYRNLIKALAVYAPDVQTVTEQEDHDILFAFSPTTVSGETIRRSKEAGAKFVLRMDGVPEDSRNSGHGTRRLVEYALQADLIIYQSDFVATTVGRIMQNNGAHSPYLVIPNGVDTDVYRPDGEKIAFTGKPNILSIAYRKDNNKRYEETLAMYREYWLNNKHANLVLLGRYPTEWQDYNMGFFNGERFQRLGVQTDDAAKAAMIRSCDFLFYPSFADPSPNVVLEALACGVPVMYNGYGGVEEIVRKHAGRVILNELTYTEQIELMLKSLEVYRLRAKEIIATRTLDIMAGRYKMAFEIAADGGR